MDESEVVKSQITFKQAHFYEIFPPLLQIFQHENERKSIMIYI